jgi:hypothetical protein
MTHPTDSTSLTDVASPSTEGERLMIALFGYSAHRVAWQRYQHQLGQSLLRKFKRERQPQPKRRHRQPTLRQPVPGGLLTAAQAAAKLNCSIKTLLAHVDAGELKYVTIGRGTKRPRKKFTVGDLDEFIANQTRKDSPCLSTASPGRRSGTTISSTKVTAFSDLQRKRLDAKPKR